MKTVVIGNSGSGKTWLATRIASITGAEVVHLDGLFWESEGFNRKRTFDEVRRLIAQTKERDSWIVEGVFGDLAKYYVHAADVLVWLDIAWSICEHRLQMRGSESKAHMGREQSEAGLKELIEWASIYSTRDSDCSFSAHEGIFNNFPRTSYRLSNDRQVMAFLRDVQQAHGADA